MKYPIFILVLLLAGTGMAADLTPYNHVFGGNSYSGARNASVTWLAERYDLGIGGLSDWPDMFDSIWDSANSWGAEFRCGPYASVHELNMAQSLPVDWSDSSYAARLLNIEFFWVYIYAEYFADSVGMDIESLTVHYDDEEVSITQQVGGNRSYDLTLLNYKQSRFSYQYWNNNSGDTAMYPAGYAWLANGFNNTTRAAIGYSYRRHLIEDSSTYGRGGSAMWTAFFSDNMYRGGYAPRLYTYYAIISTFGGPTVYMDWVEAGQIENDADTLVDYYDNSTLAIIEEVRDSLNTTTAANSLDTIYAFGNVDKFNSYMFDVQIKKMNCVLENPLDYGKGWAFYRNWLRISDTMGNRNPGTGGQVDQRYLLWMHLTDALIDEGGWRTGDRMYMAHYAFHMNVYHSNIYVGMNRFNDISRWRSIYEVDFGSNFVVRELTDSAGTGDYGDKNYVMQRMITNGSNDSTLWLFRSGTGKNCYFMADTCANDSSDCPGGLGSACDSAVSFGDAIYDSIPVALGNDYYSIDVNADTAVTTVNTVYLHVYEGWCGIRGAPPGAQLKGEVHPKGVYPKGVIGK